MLGKLSGVARIVGVLLAVVAGIVAIPGLDVALVLVVLGIIVGIGGERDQTLLLLVAAVALPLVGDTLTGIPAVGGYLNGILDNLALLIAGHAATSVALATYNIVMGDVKGLGGGS